jgi:hypothetical protein
MMIVIVQGSVIFCFLGPDTILFSLNWSLFSQGERQIQVNLWNVFLFPTQGHDSNSLSSNTSLAVTFLFNLLNVSNKMLSKS